MSEAAKCGQCKVADASYSLRLSNGEVPLCEADAVTIDEKEGHLLPVGCIRRVLTTGSGKGK